MQITVGSFRFSPRLGLSLLTLLILALLLRLGFWQLSRAEEKRTLIQEHTTAGATLKQINENGVGRFSRVSVQGVWDPDRVFLLDNMVHDTRPGYHVLVPLQTPEEVWVLVNMGWIASTGTRDQLPSVPRLETDSIELQGRLNRLPVPGLRLEAPAPAEGEPWPRVVVFPTMDQLEQQLGLSLFPWMLQVEGERDGFVRDWRLVSFGPERHVGYAFQWFALSLALVIIFIVVNTRRMNRG